MSVVRRSPDENAQAFRIMFVCTGNICRSPMAEVVLCALSERANLLDRVTVQSAATGDWHVGEQADRRTIAALSRRGYDGTRHRARQFDPSEFDELDLVVAFDRSQERLLNHWARTEADLAKVAMMLSFDPDLAPLHDVPDPYYSDEATFDHVLDLIERGCFGLFRQLAPALRRLA